MKYAKEQKEAWEILEKETDLSLGKRMKIRSTFAQTFKDDMPFISVEEYKDGEPKSYKSELWQISNLIFHSEEEVNLANAMVIAMGDNFNRNDFIHQFKATLRILGIESEWSK